MIYELELLVGRVRCLVRGHKPVSPALTKSICRRCLRRMVKHDGRWYVE